MEAKELIEQAKNGVVDQAYIKGCPNSPQEWFISTEKLIPLQEMAIFKAGRKQGINDAIDNLKMHHCIVDVEARIKEIENGE